MDDPDASPDTRKRALKSRRSCAYHAAQAAALARGASEEVAKAEAKQVMWQYVSTCVHVYIMCTCIHACMVSHMHTLRPTRMPSRWPCSIRVAISSSFPLSFSLMTDGVAPCWLQWQSHVCCG